MCILVLLAITMNLSLHNFFFITLYLMEMYIIVKKEYFFSDGVVVIFFIVVCFLTIFQALSNEKVKIHTKFHLLVKITQPVITETI